MSSIFKAIADNTNPNSLAARLRGRRLAFFHSLVAQLNGPIKVLDIGGTADFWRLSGWDPGMEVDLTLLNLSEQVVTGSNFASIRGDARDLQFSDASFDIVFSNSVIEHVGGFADQQQMACEVMRVGRRHFIQTPNRYFPIEPHFLFPLFQFLPMDFRTGLLRRFNLGWFNREPDPQRAREIVEGVCLLSKREMCDLFPKSRLFEEKFLWMTKSLTAYGGWE